MKPYSTKSKDVGCFNLLTLHKVSETMKVCFVLCVLSTVVVSCSGEYSRFEKSFNNSPGMMQVLRETLTDLSQEAHSYLVHLVGARSVETAQKVRHKE